MGEGKFILGRPRKGRQHEHAAPRQGSTRVGAPGQQRAGGGSSAATQKPRKTVIKSTIVSDETHARIAQRASAVSPQGHEPWSFAPPLKDRRSSPSVERAAARQARMAARRGAADDVGRHDR